MATTSGRRLSAAEKRLRMIAKGLLWGGGPTDPVEKAALRAEWIRLNERLNKD